MWSAVPVVDGAPCGAGPAREGARGPRRIPGRPGGRPARCSDRSRGGRQRSPVVRTAPGREPGHGARPEPCAPPRHGRQRVEYSGGPGGNASKSGRSREARPGGSGMQGGRGRKRPWEPAAGCLRVPVASPSQARTGHAERGDTRARQSPDSPGAPGRFEGLEIGIRQGYRRRPHPGRRLAPGTVPWATSPGTPRRPSRSARWASCVNSLVGWSTSPPAPSPLLPWRGRRGVRGVHWLHKPYPAYTLCPGTCRRA